MGSDTGKLRLWAGPITDMRYLGGKTKIGKSIARYLTDLRQPGQTYYEPFVGACGVFKHMDDPKVGSDSCKDLILMYQALQNGWIPPVSVPKEMYRTLSKFPPSAMRAFAGFGCSFSGNWFSGYATSEGRNFAFEARNSLLRMLPSIIDAEFIHQDYRDSVFLPNSLIYCDPPYPYNIGYSSSGELDLSVFWGTM